jgi:hypothetical protein
MMKTSDYKVALEDAAKTLEEVENLLFTAIVNVGFAGEYSDISQLHDEGEVLTLELPMFEDTDDQNLTLLTGVLKEIVAAKERLINLNGLRLEVD